MEKLISKAVDEHNEYECFKEYHYNDYKPNYVREDKTDASLLHRITVNYIRHQMTDYEIYFEALFSGAGRPETYKLLKNRILNAIAEQYPKLADACSKQMITT